MYLRMKLYREDTNEVEENYLIINSDTTTFENVNIPTVCNCISETPVYKNFYIDRHHGNGDKILSIKSQFYYNSVTPTMLEIQINYFGDGRIEKDVVLNIDQDWNVRDSFEEKIFAELSHERKKNDFIHVIYNVHADSFLRQLMKKKKSWKNIKNGAVELIQKYANRKSTRTTTYFIEVNEDPSKTVAEFQEKKKRPMQQLYMVI